MGRQPDVPHKQLEFQAFLELLEGDDEMFKATWASIADMLGVHPDTIGRWKNHPEARKLMQKGVKKALKGMKTAGIDDWRMWREYAKLMGLRDVQNVDHTSDGKPIKFATINYADVKDDTEDDTV